jgi:hypothetical protein
MSNSTCTFSEPISFDIGFGLPCEEIVKRIKDDNLIIILDGCIYAESPYGHYGATIDITMSIEDHEGNTLYYPHLTRGTPMSVEYFLLGAGYNEARIEEFEIKVKDDNTATVTFHKFVY